MDASDIHTLIDYHYWARDRVLAAASPLASDAFTRDLGSSFKSVRDTLTHAYSAEWAWCERWNGRSPTAHVSPDSVPDVPTLRQKWNGLEADVRGVLARIGGQGVDRVFQYTMLNGDPRASIFWQML